MKLYSATVQLGGDADNQVRKHKLTPAEMKVLEVIHAGKKAALIDIKRTGSVNRTDRKERARLELLYGSDVLVGTKYHGLVQKLFGVEGVPLPKEYEAPVVQAIESFDDNDDQPEVEEMIDPSERTPVRAVTAADIVG